MEYELKNNPIYKVVCAKPEEMTLRKLCDAYENVDYGMSFKIINKSFLEPFFRMNDPAQMRRRRNLLKVATLVDVLDKHRKGSETIQDKVRDEVDKVEQLLASP